MLFRTVMREMRICRSSRNRIRRNVSGNLKRVFWSRSDKESNNDPNFRFFQNQRRGQNRMGNEDRDTAYTVPPASSEIKGPVIPRKFHPIVKNEKIDLASFLFGMVSGNQGSEEAYQSRFTFEDICMDKGILNKKSVKLPDVEGKGAFMGGPNPGSITGGISSRL